MTLNRTRRRRVGKRSVLLDTLAAAVLFLGVCPSLPGGAVESETTAHVLESGLKVLIREKHTTPAVAVQVWYRVGSQDEREGIRGIAHLFEHMMFQGSAHYGPEEHHRLIREVGGTSKAYTFFDRTVYSQCLPSRALKLALRLESDRMHRLKLTQQTLDKEREDVKEEFLQYLNDPFFELLTQALPVLYPGHPYSLTPMGVLEDIDSFTLEDCREFYDRYYAPNNAVLVIVGDVDTEHALELCRRHFDSLPSKTVPPRPDLSKVASAGNDPHILRAAIPVQMTAVVYPIPEAGHPDTTALRVLANILSGGPSCRLYASLVRDREIAVQCLGYPIMVQGPGVFACVAVHLPHISSRKVQEAILEEVNRLKTEGVTDEELEKARKGFLVSKVFRRYAVESLANGLGYAEVVRGDYRLFDKEVEEFRDVTAADIRRVADEYLSKDSATVLHGKPRKQNWLIWLYGVFKSLF